LNQIGGSGPEDPDTIKSFRIHNTAVNTTVLQNLLLFQAFASLHETTKIRLLSQAWSDLFVLGLAQAKKVSTGWLARRAGTKWGPTFILSLA
jgi:hypothetical protein